MTLVEDLNMGVIGLGGTAVIARYLFKLDWSEAVFIAMLVSSSAIAVLHWYTSEPPA
jgi:Kef-type K+ transport system membrane component KefB